MANRRKESARNSFEYFRSEYVRNTGREPETVFADDDYQFEWFVRDMESAREHFKPPSDDPVIALSQQKKLNEAVDRAVARSVENAGRQAMIYAVEEDDEPEEVEDDSQEEFETEPDPEPEYEPDPEPEPEPVPEKKPKKPKKKKAKKPKLKKLKGKAAVKAVKGWARVATGERTCAWCLMLVSRGPVYKSTYDAGLDMEDYLAVQLYDNGKKFKKSDMNQWHPGCDCKVVPVFDTRSWPGREEAEKALEMWYEADAEAREIIENDPKLTLSDLNRETQNALRRRLYREAKKSSSLAA